ncbi:MAG: glycoside hydrolase domain-containing protein, partial [Puniceicoccales bacterium]
AVPGVDYREALRACIHNAEKDSPAPTYCGRYRAEYETLGYLSTNIPKGCVSRHIEYTYQDWNIARLAEHLGESGVAQRFDRKSGRLWNLWNNDARSFLPRDPSGNWIPVNSPERQEWDGWNDPFSYESSLAFWSLCPMQDIPGLIHRHGGNESFTHYLQAFLQRHPKIEKETRMIVPHLFAFAGRPDLTADFIHRSLNENYANAPDGMPDDEDMGCQSAYYISNAIGLYPVYGQTLYSLVPPQFEKSILRFGCTGKSLTIIREGNGHHIASARINDTPIPGTLIDHNLLQNGGTLRILLQ